MVERQRGPVHGCGNAWNAYVDGVAAESGNSGAAAVSV